MNMLPYSDHHKTFRMQLREFLSSEVIPYVDQWESDHIVPKAVWKKMGRAGFLCTAVSKEYGGLGGDFLYSVIVIEEMVKTNHTGLMVQLHSDIVVPYLDSFGTESQKRKFLPGCVSGDIVMAVAMTEPDAGSDLASMRTSAEEEGDQVVINGAKTFISNGINCDLVVLAAKDPAVDHPHKAVSLYLVENNTPGFKKGRQLLKMGMHSQDTAELFFTNCRIPREHLLGKKGQGFIQLMQKLQQERLVCSIWALAIAETILEWTENYCRNNPGVGKPLAASQAVQFALVEMMTETRIGRAFIHQLVIDHMHNKADATETSMAKYWISDMANRVANRCLCLVGDVASQESCPIVRMWRDIRVFSIFAGTNEIMKNIIAKAKAF
ncbi:Acyl-CoA dehydrogenase domain protein [Desulfosarcina cetonica]|uniref:acyl-CoA dehydrogenase family protein n=1 Tax=Desulfosarcina cetonica TaxID=90730 RepID=UPI0006D22C36|nr:acyl-CoA dehydrogenase family protein [Desulfosarcina cetonica]VTR67025.1 Acyl-CoA dehydrogenase domain protein [Desulfosarcina cetonica]